MKQQTNPPAFRVWCNDDKKWLDETICLLGSDNTVSIVDIHGQLEPIPNPTICRFTGLFDVKGKPVYENDVISAYGNSIKVLVKSDLLTLTSIQNSKIFENLGSSLENPELLEGLE